MGLAKASPLIQTLAGISMTTLQFRLLLIASLVTGITAGFFDFVFPSTIPESFMQAQAAYDAKQSTTSLIYLLVTCLVGVAGLISTFIGLFRFRPWAPRIAVFTTLILVLAYPAMGVTVSSGWASALTELSSYIWGFILAVVYYSPIKEKFIATR